MLSSYIVDSVSDITTETSATGTAFYDNGDVMSAGTVDYALIVLLTLLLGFCL
jgi:hypothetical protein